MKKLFIITFIVSWVQSTTAQRINFATHVQDETINLNFASNPLGLNFNDKQRIIIVGDITPVTINLTDNQAVVLEVEAPIEYDLTVEFSWTPGLSYLGLDTGTLIPFNLGIGYNNTGELSDMDRRATAVEVPSAFKTVTLPVRRRTGGGPPLPPPTPDHEGFVRQRGKVFLYVYGTLGPIPNNIPSGNYLGSIDIYINYNENNF